MRALVAGARLRVRLGRRRLAAERARGLGRFLALIGMAAGIGLLVFSATAAGGWYLASKGVIELLFSSVSALYLGVMGALWLSSLGHSVNAFFTAHDLWFWSSAPAPPWARFADRALATGGAALPATAGLGALALLGLLSGYGVALGALLRALVALLLVALLPLFAGICLAHVGAWFLPAGRLRRASLFVVALAAVSLLVALRSARLEEVLTPQGAQRFFEEARELGSIGPSWLPSSLATEVVLRGDLVAFAALMGVVLVVGWFAYASHRLCYARARDRADDDSPMGLVPASWRARLLRAFAAFVPPNLRPLVVKDVLTWLRDPSQWTQLLLLAGLAVLYVVNAQALAEGFRQFRQLGGVLLASMHVGLVTFIAAGLSARFAFPQLSLEGPAVWMLDAAPWSAARVLRAKLRATVPVVVGFPVAVAAGGGLVLGLDPLAWTVCVALCAFVAACLAAFALGRGSIAPVFDALSVSELAMAPGALSSMAVAVGVCALSFLATLLAGTWWWRVEGVWAAGAIVPPLAVCALAALLARRSLRLAAGAMDQRFADGSASEIASALPPRVDA